MFQFDMSKFFHGGMSLFKQNSYLDDKLTDQNYPFEEYLNDDDAISCVRIMGENTKKYFNSEKVKKLIKLITEEPTEDNQLKGHKFPYVASEILKSDCPFIQDRFILTENEYNEMHQLKNFECEDGIDENDHKFWDLDDDKKNEILEEDVEKTFEKIAEQIRDSDHRFQIEEIENKKLENKDNNDEVINDDALVDKKIENNEENENKIKNEENKNDNVDKGEGDKENNNEIKENNENEGEEKNNDINGNEKNENKEIKKCENNKNEENKNDEEEIKKEEIVLDKEENKIEEGKNNQEKNNDKIENDINQVDKENKDNENEKKENIKTKEENNEKQIKEETEKKENNNEKLVKEENIITNENKEKEINKESTIEKNINENNENGQNEPEKKIDFQENENIVKNTNNFNEKNQQIENNKIEKENDQKIEKICENDEDDLLEIVDIEPIIIDFEEKNEKENIIKENGISNKNNNKSKENLQNEEEIPKEELNEGSGNIIVNYDEKPENEEEEINNIKNDSISIEGEIKEESFKKEVQNPNNEFMDLLLNFVMNNKPELNYVLSGYFANVMISLLDKYPSQLLKYLYTIRKDAVKQIVFHSNQKAFSMLALKILNIENYVSSILNKVKSDPKNEENKKILENVENNIKYRNELICDIIKSLNLNGFKDNLNVNHSEYDCEGRFSLLNDIINENKTIVSLIYSNKEIYNHLFNILDNDLYNKDNNEIEYHCDNKIFIYGLFINFVTKLLKCLFLNNDFIFPKDFDFSSVIRAENDKSGLSFNENLIITFGHILKSNFLDNKKNNKLGYLNIKIMFLVKEMFHFMKEIPKQFDMLLIRNNFCERSVDYFFKYENNNIYHIEFVNLFKLYLTDEKTHNELTQFFFNHMKFHEILINNLDKINIKHCLHSNIIDLIYKIQVISGLETFTEDEKTNLKIKNLGEFEFIRDENSSRIINTINISEDIKNILKNSSKWDEIFKNKVMPFLKIYEAKLCQEKSRKNSDDLDSNDNDEYNTNKMATQKLLNIIKKDYSYNPKRKPISIIRNGRNLSRNQPNKKDSIREKILNSGFKNKKQMFIYDDDDNKETEEESNNNKYNDSNYWNNNNIIFNDIKNEKSETVDEEDEILSLTKKMEQNEKENKNNNDIIPFIINNYKSNIIKEKDKKQKLINLKTNKKMGFGIPSPNNKIVKNIPLFDDDDDEDNKNEKNENNEENEEEEENVVKKDEDKGDNKEKCEDKETYEKRSEYNDNNYWEINPEKNLNDNIIKELLSDLE